MTMILDLLKDAFEHAKFPKSFYEAKNVINNLGLNYVKIPACPKDCIGVKIIKVWKNVNGAKHLSGKIKTRSNKQKYCVTFH